MTNGYWLVVRSDKKVIVVDDPERVYSVGRNPELPAAQQLHHKYISREHLRLRYAPPSLLVFQIGKNPTFYGSECHRVPGKSDIVNEKVKLQVDEHDKEEQFTLQTIADTNIPDTNNNTNVASSFSNFHHDANDKDHDNAVDDHHDYSKALVFCVLSHKEGCINDSVGCKEYKQQSLTEGTQANNSVTMESPNCSSTNDDNIVYVDAMQCESAHNAPERECIDQSTLYFPDELHLPTLTVRYVQCTEVNSNNKQNEHIATTPKEVKNNAVKSESTIDSVHKNNVDNITASQRSAPTPAPTPAQMLAVPILKDEQEEEEQEEELISDANHNAITSTIHSTNEDSSQQNTTLLSQKEKNDNNDDLFTEGDSKAYEYRKEWQGLLNEAMKEEQQRLAELKELELNESKEQEEEEEYTGNNDTSYVCNSKDKPTQISNSIKNKTVVNKKELTSTRAPYNYTSNANTTQYEAAIPFGSSSAKYKNVKHKESDITQNTSTRKRPRPSTTIRGRGNRRRGNSTSSSSSSESSASLSEESSSESESSFTSTSSSFDDDDDDDYSSTSSSSSESSSTE